MFTRFSRFDNQLQLLEENTVFDGSVLFNTESHHLHKTTSNRSFEWYATDQLDRLNPKNSYSENRITYDFNNHGYRCDTLQKSKIMFLGCSYTFGVGLNSTEVWAHQVAKELKAPYINLSYPGGSPSYVLRTIFKCYEAIKPKIVIVLIPYNYRFEFISADQNEFLKVWSKSGTSSKSFSGQDQERIYSYESFTTKENEEFELLKTMFLMNTFLKDKSSLLYWTAWEYDQKPTLTFSKNRGNPQFGKYLETDIFNRHTRYQSLEDKARDSTHPSAKFHKLYSQFIIENINA